MTFILFLITIVTAMQVSDGDHIDRLLSCLYMALPFFMVCTIHACIDEVLTFGSCFFLTHIMGTGNLPNPPFLFSTEGCFE